MRKAIFFSVLWFALITHAVPCANAQTSFIQSIDMQARFSKWVDVEAQLKVHSKIPHHYLSLGETHLEKTTALSVMMKFAETYLVDNNPGNSSRKKACIEVNTSLIALASEWVNQNYETVEIRQRNSPSLTDFNYCYDSHASSQLLYSGLSHQYSWNHFFPGLFDPTPVQSNASNTIISQMKPGVGFFISQIELPYLLYLETRAILNKSILHPEQLNVISAQLKSAVSTVRSKMEVLSDASNPWEKKHGVFLNSASFINRPNLPQNSFFVLTDLEYRLNSSPTFFLDELMKLSDSARTVLFKLLKSNRWAYSQIFLTPDSAGAPSSGFVMGFSKPFAGEASVLGVSLKDQSLTLANSNTPAETGLKCVLRAKTENAVARVMDCEAALLELAL